MNTCTESRESLKKAPAILFKMGLFLTVWGIAFAMPHPEKLAPCPASPNCVSSQHDDVNDTTHHIAPIRSSQLEQTWRNLRVYLEKQGRVEIIEASDNYIHAVFTSLLFRFKDDVEFLKSEGDAVIHMRSASRVGHSDLGVNRKRLEGIRKAIL